MDASGDEEILQMLMRSKKLLEINSEGLRRRPIHPEAEDSEEISDEESREIQLIKEKCKKELLVEPQPVSSTVSYIYVFLVFGCCLLAACFIHFYLHKSMASSDPELLEQYRKGIAPYKRQFPSQSNELWSNVFNGIQLTSTSNRLSVFLLLHDDTTNTSCLAYALGRVSAALLGNSTQPLILLASDLDHSEGFRQDLADRRAIVVEEVQKMPAGDDQKLLLHGLADSENPIVPGIAVVFTLKIQEESTKSALRTAELELDRVWEWIDLESRLPLIVRVTSGFVYKMANEREVIHC